MRKVRSAAILIATAGMLAVVVLSLLVLAAFEAGVLLLAGTVYRLGLRRPRSRRRNSSGRVIDGEYTVLAEPVSPARHGRA